ncbi:MAG: S8 family serine peptidase [Polyangiaceae bacterium]|nr:S8 family serine peptidase [Polyangiaceae bacterium]
MAPNGVEHSVSLGENGTIQHNGQEWGKIYHRANEPNSGLNHIDIFLRAAAPSGRWRIGLRGREVVDGRLHAWIERDAPGRNQSRILRSQATSLFTTNTICNSFRAIAVGAYDGTRPDRPATRFSSRGPTADGRQKPELVAPGHRILAARSTPPGGFQGERPLIAKSGTSMAAPWVSGTIALMYQAAGRKLTIHEVRSLLIGTADPHNGPPGRTSTRLGYGYLNTVAAVEAARRLRGENNTNVGWKVPSPAESVVENDNLPNPADRALGLPIAKDATLSIAPHAPPNEDQAYTSAATQTPPRIVESALSESDENDENDENEDQRAGSPWSCDTDMEDLNEALIELGLEVE